MVHIINTKESKNLLRDRVIVGQNFVIPFRFLSLINSSTLSFVSSLIKTSVLINISFYNFDLLILGNTFSLYPSTLIISRITSFHVIHMLTNFLFSNSTQEETTLLTKSSTSVKFFVFIRLWILLKHPKLRTFKY